MASADLLLHPVRLRLVKTFLGDRALTTKQLAVELADVPAGSIYRDRANPCGPTGLVWHLARDTKPGLVAPTITAKPRTGRRDYQRTTPRVGFGH
jgi:hypothetical protein